MRNSELDFGFTAGRDSEWRATRAPARASLSIMIMVRAEAAAAATAPLRLTLNAAL